MQVLAQKRTEPTYAAIIFSTESVFAALGGLLWNLIAPEHLRVSQEILPIGYVGCGIIFAGIVLSQLEFKKKQAKEP
jgi:drug/metabolite transporter (DMT)-like permease